MLVYNILTNDGRVVGKHTTSAAPGRTKHFPGVLCRRPRMGAARNPPTVFYTSNDHFTPMWGLMMKYGTAGTRWIIGILYYRGWMVTKRAYLLLCWALNVIKWLLLSTFAIFLRRTLHRSIFITTYEYLTLYYRTDCNSQISFSHIQFKNYIDMCKLY